MSKYPQYIRPDRDQELRLVEQSLAGDQSAFGAIYSMYFPRVFAFCLKRVNDRAEAEDLAQETFVQLYRSLESFEGRSSLLTWTFGIAHNVCSRYYRHCSRWMIGSRDGQELEERPVAATTERRIDAMRVLKRCDEVLESSRRPAHREIFRLRYGESLPIRSIAERVGKSKDAVKVSLRRSRSALTNGVPELGAVLDNVAQSA
jgi:RNA polymerase sigma-70 factor (ECF subfamily)